MWMSPQDKSGSKSKNWGEERTNLFLKFSAALKRHPQYDAAADALALHQDLTRCPELLTLKHEERRILWHSSNPVCGFSIMEQVRLCAVWPTENWLGSSLNHIQGWTTVGDTYSHALEQGPLPLPCARRGMHGVADVWSFVWANKLELARHFHVSCGVYTVVHPLVRDILLNGFWEIPWLVGWYWCSYLFPQQAPTTHRKI